MALFANRKEDEMYRVCCVRRWTITPSTFAACANGARYAGCAGPNGVATYNKSTGQAHSYNCQHRPHQLRHQGSATRLRVGERAQCLPLSGGQV
jgi:hypothetical protein